MQPALETLSPRYFLTKTLEETAHWLNDQRVPMKELAQIGEDYAQLRQEFGQLSHRWHPLLTNPRLQESSLKAVHELAVKALDVSKLIYQELENQRQGQSQLVPKMALARLLEFNSLLLDRVTAQLGLVESTAYYAEELHAIAQKLVAGETLTSVGLVSLARRIQLEIRPRPELCQWLPMPGFPLWDCLPVQKRISEPEVYTTGIQSARLVAWLAAHQPQISDRWELLLVAALLQDVGFLRSESRTPKPPSALIVNYQGTYRKHPPVGAALAAGVSGYSIELSFLIAQHHERLDGTGYPHGLTRFKQTKDVQLLACLVRFQELLSRMSPEEAQTTEAACYQAGFQLFLESAQGAWSTSVTVDLLEALDIELPKSFDLALATGQPFDAEIFLEKRWSCHSAELDVPSPHFLFSRSNAFGRSARQTVANNGQKVIRRDPKG